MAPDLNQIDFYKVLFWVIIVLVAGFIGQFGKSFAKYLMEHFGKKPSGSTGPERQQKAEGGQKDAVPAPFEPPSAGPALSKEESKIRKKELKAELKRKKKENK